LPHGGAQAAKPLAQAKEGQLQEKDPQRFFGSLLYRPQTAQNFSSRPYAYSKVRDTLQRRHGETDRWCGRLVKVVDGTGLSMPDTKENQEAFPQNGQQKKGCGFPTLKLVGCFCLHTGAWLHWAVDSLHTHEAKLWRKLWAFFHAGDVVLGDRGFSSYGSLAGLLNQGVDTVFRAHQAKKISFSEGDRLSACERVQIWRRPQFPQNATWERKAWLALPKELKVRVLRFRVQVPGWRSEEIVLCTTLLDRERYPYEKLAELYLRRWAVELYFRDLKTTLGMDVLRCQSPEMVIKEIAMFAIAYNIIRSLIYEASLETGLAIEHFSFKGTLDTLRTWEAQFRWQESPAVISRIRGELIDVVARDRLPRRPWRNEPRAVKRRPKSYQLLTSPRHEMTVSPSRKKH
jgi:hypothetical protein